MDVHDYKGPVPGDIVLLNSTGRAAKRNRTLQFVPTGLRAKFTHVAFCTGLATFVHADGKIVDFIVADELFGQYPGVWRAIRHARMNKMGRAESTTVIRSADYYLGMAYAQGLTKFLGESPLEGETFCSLLVKDVFAQMNIDILAPYAKPYPVHFQQLPEDEPDIWSDVTEEHLIGHDILRKYPDQRVLAAKICASARETRKTILEIKELHDLMFQFQQSMKKLDEKIGAVRTEYVEVPEPEYSVKYWDRMDKTKPQGD